MNKGSGDSGGGFSFFRIALTAMLVVIILFAAGVPMMMASVDRVNLSNLDYALDYWGTRGYVAYADPAGDLTLTGDLDVSGSITTDDLQAPTGRTAYVIAASDAPATWKAQADVVCDGTADNVEIQAAISAGYYNIQLSPGTFTLAAALVFNSKDNLHITGTGTNTILQASGNNDIVSVNGASFAFGFDIRISQLTFVSDRTKTGYAINASYTTGFVIEDVGFTGFLNTVYIDLTRELRWENCVIENCGNVATTTAAITMVASSDQNTTTSFEKCKFYGNYYADFKTPNQFHQLSFHNCTFEAINRGGTTEPQYAHILVSADIITNNFIVDDNDFIDAGGMTGIDIRHGGSINGGFISHNRFQHNGASNCIQIKALRWGSIDHNSIISVAAGGTGIKVNNVTGQSSISDNTINLTSATAGIDIMGDNFSIISGNEIISVTTGIIINWTGSLKIIGNSIITATTGISIGANSDKTHITDNTFLGVTTPVSNSGTNTTVEGNPGYIARGEIRTYSGTIATLTENAFNSLDNPFGQAVRVLALDVNISTGATATTPDIDCGIGSSATTDYATMFDDLPGETVGFYRSIITTPGTQTVPILWASGSGNRYLNMSIKGAAATGMVATYTVTVMGN